MIRKVGVGAVLGDCVDDGRVSVDEVLGDRVRASSRITAAAPHCSSLILQFGSVTQAVNLQDHPWERLCRTSRAPRPKEDITWNFE